MRKPEQYVGIARIAFGHFDADMRPKIGFIDAFHSFGLLEPGP